MLQGLIIHINIMEAVGITLDTQTIVAREGAVRNTDKIGKADEVYLSTGI